MQLLHGPQHIVWVVAEVVLALGEPHLVDPIDQCLERPVELAPRERRTQAVMLARSESHVPPGMRSVKVDRVRGVKASLVSIRGRKSNIDQAARGNRHAR